jgi:uncharacterized RDD family membrane protein YckC
MIGQALAQDSGALQAPSLARRMACFVYEATLLFGIGLIPGAIGAWFVAQTGHQHPLQSEAALRVYAFVIYGIYFTWFWSRRGQTLAMQTWRIALVTPNGGSPSQGRALLRYLLACLWFLPATLLALLARLTPWQTLSSVAVGIVSYALLTLLRSDRQFWHDALAGTRLIDVRGEPPRRRRG